MKRAVAVLVAGVLAAMPVRGEDASSNGNSPLNERYIIECNKYRNDQIESLLADRSALEALQLDEWHAPRDATPSKEVAKRRRERRKLEQEFKNEKAKLIAAINSEITRLRDPHTHVVPVLKFDPRLIEKGDMGAVVGRRSIEQVVDSHNALIWVCDEVKSHEFVAGPSGILRQPPEYTKKYLAWFSNLDTDGFVDGESFEIRGIFEFIGTRTYATAGGSQTVREFRRVPELE